MPFDGAIIASRTAFRRCQPDRRCDQRFHRQCFAAVHYKTFMWPEGACAVVMNRSFARAASLGKAPGKEPDADRAHALCPFGVLVAGGSADGLT